MIRPAGEMSGVGLDVLAGDDGAGDDVGVGDVFGDEAGVGEPERVPSVEASGTGLIVSERDLVSIGPPPLLRLSHARKTTSTTRPIRTISRVLVRWCAAHFMTQDR